jgi:hypothetical protein
MAIGNEWLGSGCVDEAEAVNVNGLPMAWCCGEVKSCVGKGCGRCSGGDDTRDPFVDDIPALDEGGVGKSERPILGDSFLGIELFVFIGSESPRLVERYARS